MYKLSDKNRKLHEKNNTVTSRRLVRLNDNKKRYESILVGKVIQESWIEVGIGPLDEAKSIFIEYL